MTSTPSNIKKEFTCPYLGFITDDQTAMAYPSVHNYCHHCLPPNVPKISHQREYCLADLYNECPIFLAQKDQPMPLDIQTESGKPTLSTRNQGVLLAVLVGLVVLIVALFGLNVLGRKMVAKAFTPTANESAITISPTVEIATATPTPSATATLAEPTLTSTPVPPHVLETPIGTANQLLVHRLLDGENLTLLAGTYQTTVAAIQAVNVENMTFWANSLIVIPVGQTDVSTLPRFKVIMMTDVPISIQELSTQYNVDAQVLAQFNFVPITYTFQSGEWVLIPVSAAAN